MLNANVSKLQDCYKMVTFEDSTAIEIDYFISTVWVETYKKQKTINILQKTTINAIPEKFYYYKKSGSLSFNSVAEQIFYEENH